MTVSEATVHDEPTAADASAIEATIADYYLGWYDGDPDRMAKALHPALVKRGWLPDASGAMFLDEDTAGTMIDATRQAFGRRSEPDERRYDVSGIHVHRGIASANVSSVPYVDYLHLIRTTEGWRIVNALWCKP
jgi:Putative lumazine-binding